MGLIQDYLTYIDECIRQNFGELRNLHMLELGNQQILEEEEDVSERTGKEYYSSRGVHHMSIDLNGRDGALSFDLSKEIHNDFHSKFDVVTNAGTSEHIEPKSAQYQCFKNIHDCLKKGGIAIHIVPDVEELIQVGAWENHCKNYYSRQFVKMLAETNGYYVISITRINALLCFCLKKEFDNAFMSDKRRFLRLIERRKGGTIYQGINDRGINIFHTVFLRAMAILMKRIYDNK